MNTNVCKKFKAEVNELYVRKRVRGLPVCTFFYWCKVNLRKFQVHRENMNLIWIEGKNENLVLLTTRGRLFYFWGEYAVNCRKKYPADWFREKKILARKYLGEKISYTFMAYNPGKKSYTVTLYVMVCRSITRGLEKNKFSPKPNYYSPRLLNSTHQLTHTFPPGQKSNENLKECRQDHHI